MSYASSRVEDELLREPWAYLLGLYLTDGSLNLSYRSCWRVSFYLAGDEGALVVKVCSLLSRLGWKPKVRPPAVSNCFTIRVSGSRSQPPFPDKKQILSGDGGQKWLTDEGLGSELAIPFIAGLLDGDGYIKASFHGKGVFGHVDERWAFYQKSYPSLAEFLLAYVRSISRGGAVQNKNRAGTHTVHILREGRLALLEGGIARWSFKISKFQRDREAIGRRIADVRSNFLTVTETARKLGVDVTTVMRWCRLGYVRHIKVRGKSCKNDHYRCLLPAEEVGRNISEIHHTDQE